MELLHNYDELVTHSHARKRGSVKITKVAVTVGREVQLALFLRTLAKKCGNARKLRPGDGMPSYVIWIVSDNGVVRCFPENW